MAKFSIKIDKWCVWASLSSEGYLDEQFIIKHPLLLEWRIRFAKQRMLKRHEALMRAYAEHNY